MVSVVRLGSTYGCPKKLYLILRINFGAVHFSMTKMLVFPDSDMYKSFDALTLSGGGGGGGVTKLTAANQKPLAL